MLIDFFKNLLLIACRVRSLGVSKFGQSGDIDDLFAHYGLDSATMVKGAKELMQ